MGATEKTKAKGKEQNSKYGPYDVLYTFRCQLAYCCLKALTIGGGARALDDNSISLSSIIHLLFAFSDDDDESKG
jgi:hypothetical protein